LIEEWNYNGEGKIPLGVFILKKERFTKELIKEKGPDWENAGPLIGKIMQAVILTAGKEQDLNHCL